MSADATDIENLTRQMMNVAVQLEALAPEVAKARTIKDYDGERRKVLLSRGVSPLLEAESSSAAEHQTRASESYIKGIRELRQEYLSALTVIAKNDALATKLEALRSAVAVQRAIIGL